MFFVMYILVNRIILAVLFNIRAKPTHGGYTHKKDHMSLDPIEMCPGLC